MPRAHHATGLLVACLAAAFSGCGNRGDTTTSDAGAGGAGPLGGRELRVLSADPGDRAVQVATDTTLAVEFDGPLAVDSLDSPTTGLFDAATGARIATQFLLAQQGHRVTFATVAALAAETDYELRFDPLTCDVDGRLLDETVTICFRTIDTTPPQIVAWSHAAGPRPLVLEDPIVLTFDDAVDPTSVDDASVVVQDAFGSAIPFDRSVDVDRITLRPVRDVAGDRDVIVSVRGVRDRSGNRQSTAWHARLRTPTDRTPPDVVASWPSDRTAASPRIRPQFRFSESVVPTDEGFPMPWLMRNGEPVPHSSSSSRDGRTVWIHPDAPLVPGAIYEIHVGPEASPVVDGSGNTMESAATFLLTVGNDATAPRLIAGTPAIDEQRVAPYIGLRLTFDEPLDPDSIDATTVQLLDPTDTPIASDVALDPDDAATIVLTPRAPLATSSTHHVVIRGGLLGIRDPAGNPLAADLVRGFTTSESSVAPELALWPSSGTTALSPTTRFVLAADTALDPRTIDSDHLVLTDSDGSPIAVRFEVEREARVVRVVPRTPLVPGGAYRLVAKSGPDGLRAASGNWLRTAIDRRFDIGFRTDVVPPRLAVTLEGIAPARCGDRMVARSGIAVHVTTSDGFDPTFDPTSVTVELTAGTVRSNGSEPGVVVAFENDAFVLHVDAQHELPRGPVVVRASALDLSGNRSDAASLAFTATDTSADVIPFERTQVVWVRFDMDRDGNGRPDFDDDLLRLGLAAAGDPRHVNARVRAIVADGVLAQCRALFGRRADGGPRDADAVAIRLTDREPRGVTHMQIAVGGLDPEGSGNRGFGDASTGTLGRAWFDSRNQRTNDLAIATAPGLGVFPSELWLFESRVHQQVYPSFVTTFARRFLPICPDLGGIAAGENALDGVVLAEDFDVDRSTSPQRARYVAVLSAADDWATAVGTILAHEIGHTVGLTAAGTGSAGLHGDASLHNAGANTTDVMSAAIGFDAMVGLDFAFRDLNLAYLRQRIVLR